MGLDLLTLASLYRKGVWDAIGKRTEMPRIKKVKKRKRKQREIFTGERVPAVSIKEESMESDIVYKHDHLYHTAASYGLKFITPFSTDTASL